VYKILNTTKELKAQLNELKNDVKRFQISAIAVTFNAETSTDHNSHENKISEKAHEEQVNDIEEKKGKFTSPSRNSSLNPHERKRSSKNLIVPLRGGYKKQMTNLNLSDNDSSDEEGTDVILKCGWVELLSNSKWKKVWLVLPRGGSLIKYYRTLKTLHPSIIYINGFTVNEAPDNIILLTKSIDDAIRIRVGEDDKPEWIEYLRKECVRE
jgi:hypothetical protein